MKSLFAALVTVLSLTAQAGTIVLHSGPHLNAEIIADLLTDDRTPADAKKLLSTVINGQRDNQVEAILGTKKVYNNVQLEIVIEIGIDDLTDDDSGWSSVVEVRATYSADYRNRQDGQFYTLRNVVFVPTAG